MSHDHTHDHSHGAWDAAFQGTPKTMFLMGLFAGIAVSSLLALSVLAWAILGGKSLALGAMQAPAAQQVAQQPSANDPSAPPEAPGGPVKPVDEKTDHIRGPKTAKVTLIEYSDFQCPFCGRHFDTMEQVMQKYPNDVRLVYRHFPLSFHPFAQKLAEASECANELGGNDAFWKFHDETFKAMNAQTFTSLDQIPKLGSDIGLDQGKFKACVDSGKYANKVGTDEAEGGSAGVQGTPATFINGKMISGAVPLAQITAAIDAALKQ